MRKAESLANSELHRRVAVVGVGNVLMADEGVGVEVVARLQKEGLPPDVVAFDAGTAFGDVAYQFTDFDRMVIVDAVRGGGEPGSIYRFRPEDVENGSCPWSGHVSLHQMGVLESIRLLELAGTPLPNATIIGVEPAKVEFAIGLSDCLRSRMPALLEAVRGEVYRRIPASLGRPSAEPIADARDEQIHS